MTNTNLFTHVQQYCEQNKEYKKADYTLNGNIFTPLLLYFIEKPPIREQEVFEELEKIRKVVIFICATKVIYGKIALKLLPYVEKISKIDSYYSNNATNSSFVIPTNLIKIPEELEELNVVRNWMKVIIFQQMVNSTTQKAICGYLYYLTTYLGYQNVYRNFFPNNSDGTFALNYYQWLDKIYVEKKFPNMSFEQFCKRKNFKQNSIFFFTPFIELLEYIGPLENNPNQKANDMIDTFQKKFFEQNPEDTKSFLEFLVMLFRDTDRWGVIQYYYIASLISKYPKHDRYFEVCLNEFLNCQDELNKAAQKGERVIFSENLLNLEVEIDDN